MNEGTAQAIAQSVHAIAVSQYDATQQLKWIKRALWFWIISLGVAVGLTAITVAVVFFLVTN
jgi:hypothetical protein